MADLPATVVDDIIARYGPALGGAAVHAAILMRSTLPLDYLEAIRSADERLEAERPPFADLMRRFDEARAELDRVGPLYRFPTLDAAYWPAFKAANAAARLASIEVEWALWREIDRARLSPPASEAM